MNGICAQDRLSSTARLTSFTIDVHRQGYYAANTIRSGEAAPLGCSLIDDCNRFSPRRSSGSHA